MENQQNNSGRTNLLLSLIMLILLASVAMPYLNTTEEAPTLEVQAYEYTIQTINDLSWDSDMKALGDAGWELVFARRARNPVLDTYGYESIFKREKQ